MKKMLYEKMLFIPTFIVFINLSIVAAPTVSSVSPPRNSTGIELGANITVTFSEDMDQTTLNSNTIKVQGNLSGFHNGTFTYNNGTFATTFNPNSNFFPGETISVTVSTGVKNTTGSSLTSFIIWSFVVNVSPAPGTFNDATAIVSASSPVGMLLSDINRDGYLDLAELQYSSRKVVVHIGAGDGTFGSGTNYSVGANPYKLATGEINSDGYPDFAVANYGDGNISVLLSNGDGTFASAVTYTVGDNPSDLKIADLDGDGDQDLICVSAGSNSLNVLKNNGSGTFSGAVNYTLNSSSINLTLSDADLDGDLDAMVTSWNTGNLAVLMNNGNGTFAPKVNYPTVSATPRQVTAADIDSDGDEDLIVANSGSNSVTIFSNSEGIFTQGSEIASGTYPLGVLTADVDGDDDLDMITINANSSNLSVLKNGGSGSFSGKTDYATGSLPSSAAIGDIDGDGDLDLVTVNQVGNSISILKGVSPNPVVVSVSPVQNAVSIQKNSDIEVTFNCSISEASATSGSIKIYGSMNGIYTATYSFSDASKKLTINPNHDFEVGEVIKVTLTTSIKNTDNLSMEKPFTWMFNVKSESSGSFSDKTDYAVSSNPYFVESGDLDGDGDLDLVTANWVSKEVSVLKNTGTGTFDAAVNYPIGGQPNNFISADFDSDGDIDFASANTDSLTIEVLLTNSDGTLSEYDSYPIGDGLWTVTSADVDGDGDIDLISGNSYDYTLSVLKNNGDGTFASEIDYPTANNTSNIYSADVDGDGDMDLVTANYYEENVTVFLNDGTGAFNSGSDYSVGYQVSFISSADFDNDGDADIVTTASGYVSVLLNNGSGTYGSPTHYTINGAWNVHPSDIDGDGDLDLLTINYGDDKFNILKNNGNGTFAANTEVTSANTPAWIYSADLNNDGFLDIITANDETNVISVFLNKSSANATSGSFTNASFSEPTSLSGNLSVSGTLSVGAQITTGSNTIDLGTSGSISGETPENYIIGKVQTTRTVSSVQNNIGGLGISIDPQSNNMGSTVIKRETGTAENSSSIKQVWTITPETQPSGPVTVTLTWPSTNDNSINLNDLVVYKSEDGGDTWNVISATINKDTDPRTATFTISSFSSFTIGQSGALPVEMVSFTGHELNGKVLLNWSTATESNNVGWEIESRIQESGDRGQNSAWKKVGFVAGKGTTTEKQNYSFAVSSLQSSVSIVEFRLKQMDSDGKISYSNVLTIDLTPVTFGLSQNYPNPFNPITVINYQLASESDVRLFVYDLLGREVASLVNEKKAAGFYTVSFNATNISTGVYFYKLTAGNFTEIKKMTLMK